MTRLTNWYTCNKQGIPAYAAAGQPTYLAGTVYNHPEQPDGTQIRTTRVTQVEAIDSQTTSVLTKSGRTYQLSQVAEFSTRVLPQMRSTLLSAFPPKDPTQ